jgi:hypothetical protein
MFFNHIKSLKLLRSADRDDKTRADKQKGSDHDLLQEYSIEIIANSRK